MLVEGQGEQWLKGRRAECKHILYKVGPLARFSGSALTRNIGVMRFLQTEWHRHERDRNGWDIEREEMKKRIAGLEGEARTGRGIRTALEKHVRLLEVALKRERERTKGLSKGDVVDAKRDPKDLAREELKAASKGTEALPCTNGLLTLHRNTAERHECLGLRARARQPPPSRHPPGEGEGTSQKAISENAPPRFHTTSYPRHTWHPS